MQQINQTNHKIKCNCVKHYDEIIERIDTTTNTENNTNRTLQCRCDCERGNVSCEWLKKGMDGFSIEDRR